MSGTLKALQDDCIDDASKESYMYFTNDTCRCTHRKQIYLLSDSRANHARSMGDDLRHACRWRVVYHG